MASTKKWAKGLALVTLMATLGATTEAQAGPPQIPFGKGDLDRGKIKMRLTRGAAVPFELQVVATPNECQGEVELTMDWDADENWVRVRLKSENNTLEQFPDVERTEGVDYFPNPFFPEPEDYEDGRYQLWIISAAGPLVPFYYDLETLDLIGSAADFENPPPAIPVLFPTLYMFATPMFQPNSNGKVNVDWEFPYDGAIRGDRPEFAHHIVSFPPPNLCFANPFRLDQSFLRPYISDPFPAAEARPWSDYLRGGMLFDITIEPGEYAQEPPLTSLAATYSGGTAVGGAIPKGWQLDIEAAFAGLAPPIKPFAGAETCEDYTEPQHVGAGVNFCALMGG